MGRLDELERLRQEAHDAPLNKVFKDHTGHRFLGTHSMAWANASRAYAEAAGRQALEADAEAGEGGRE